MRASMVVLVTAAHLAGCSIITTKGPSSTTPMSAPDCTTSKAAVFGDGIIAGGAVGTSLFLGIAALAKQTSLADGETNQLAYATLFTFLGGVAFAVSGVVGGVRVNQCRRAHEQWRTTQQMAPMPMGPPGASPYPYPAPPQ